MTDPFITPLQLRTADRILRLLELSQQLYGDNFTTQLVAIILELNTCMDILPLGNQTPATSLVRTMLYSLGQLL